MDEKRLKFLQELVQQQSGPTSQDVALEKIRRGMTSPEQLSLEDFRLKQLKLQPTLEGTTEQDKLLESQAMQNYNSPEAQAIRARFDVDERNKQNRRFPNVNKLMGR